MNNNKAKLYWITGGSTGIGSETALKLAKAGNRVVITSRTQGDLEKVKEKAKNYDGEIIPISGDATKTEEMACIVEEIETKHGALDTVLLNAGTYKGDPVDEFSVDLFKHHFDINVYGVVHCLEPVLKKFLERGKGHIAITASVAGFRGLPRSISYGSSKAALINMTEALYMECKPKGIKVQLVSPGFVKTPLTDKNDFEMPMLMDVDDAADALIKGLNSNQFEITFPWKFVYLKKIIDLLPNKIYLWLIGKGTKTQ